MPASEPAGTLAVRLRAALGVGPEGPDTPTGPVVVMGVGSTLHSDDGAGCRVARALMDAPIPLLSAIDAGPAPENRTAEIRRRAPVHVVIVDAARMGAEPGTVRILDPREIDGVSFATHGLPLDMLIRYLRAETGCAVTVIGIQPRSVGLGEGLSLEVEAAVHATAAALREAVRTADPRDARPRGT